MESSLRYIRKYHAGEIADFGVSNKVLLFGCCLQVGGVERN